MPESEQILDEEKKGLDQRRRQELAGDPGRYFQSGAAAVRTVSTITRKRSFLDIRPEWSVIIRAAGANHLSDY